MRIKLFFFISFLLAVGANVYASAWSLPLGLHYMLDDGVRIRSEPNLRGSIIGKLELHDTIEILENTEIEQQINNVWAYWYKIRHNNLVGYIWGGFTAMAALIFDIDENGQNDYFYYRASSMVQVFDFVPEIRPTDIFIYINNRRIPVDIPEHSYSYIKWYTVCTFEVQSGKVIMQLLQLGLRETYEIDTHGTISLVERFTYDISE
jgi:hypothetical protein